MKDKSPMTQLSSTITTFKTKLQDQHTHISNAQDVISYNEKAFEEFKQAPFFKLIQSDFLINNPYKRKLFFNYMQIFSDRFQLMVFMRQGGCRDQRFEAFFLSHLEDEIGHHKLLQKHEHFEETFDPVLNAISIWFVYQMLTLDNIEKLVVMHLIIEKAGDFYHSFSNEFLGKFLDSDYYEIHSEIDEEHADIDISLIENYPEFVYHRLGLLSHKSWTMMHTMIDRVYHLVTKGEKHD
ncbi:MAG: hypothetical protein EP298_09350 [Gammaproteobacteria bacterium]|nr:MAG: hypothetical protein EP298_09350 [Gammaproteobacteria bacterium]UTW42314.1 hypothetical protein KFE69_12635 [bacterium SCSIO 12844]